MQDTNKQIILPLLPLRDVVVFSAHGDSIICWQTGIYQGSGSGDDPGKTNLSHRSKRRGGGCARGVNDLYTIGTIATVLQLLHLPDGTVKVLVEGVQRGKMINLKNEDGYFR